MREVLRNCQWIFISIFLFSFIVNLLALAIPLYMLQVFDRVLSSRSIETLIMLTLIVVGALVIDAFLQDIRSKLQIQVSLIMQKSLREPLLKASLKMHTQTENTQHALLDLRTLQQFLAGKGVMAFSEIPWIPIYLFVLWLFHGYFALVAIIGGLLMFLLTAMEEFSLRKKQAIVGIQRFESDNYVAQGQRRNNVITALGMQDSFTRHWLVLDDKHWQTQLETDNYSSILSAFSNLIRSLLQIASMGGAAFLIINEFMSPGGMIASTIIMGRAMQPMQTLIVTWQTFIKARGSYQRLHQILCQEKQQNFMPLPSPEGHLAVQRVLFFLRKDCDILNGIHFQLHSGESLGVIGTNGSGKSSLARLLVGIYKPNDGYIRLDGAEIFPLAQDGHLGAYIGYLPQEIDLFSGTIADNIARLKDPQQHADAVIEAAIQAGIHDSVLSMPDGYLTEVGEGGSNLSGGQRQGIALARALFGKPRLVVLDEPNAFMDGASEMKLLALFDDLKRMKSTLVVVSHKPSVLRTMDKILVLKNGRMEMFGAREEVFAVIYANSEL